MNGLDATRRIRKQVWGKTVTMYWADVLGGKTATKSGRAKPDATDTWSNQSTQPT